METQRIRDGTAIVVGIVFVMIGVDHFLRTQWYTPIVPEVLGFPEVWVYLSGVTEILFGGAFMVKKTRVIAAKSGIAMLVLLYWANLNMWMNDIPLNGINYSGGWHIGRLVVQLLLMGLIAWIADILPQRRSEG
jgi:uncharacterized membrane protein